MKQLSKEFVIATANTVWRQVKATATSNVIGSWGISLLYAQEVSVHTSDGDLHMAALVMQVDGFNFKGLVLVALDEVRDLYRIYTAMTEDDELQECMNAVYCDNLASCLDRIIERGDMTDEQYRRRIQASLVAF